MGSSNAGIYAVKFYPLGVPIHVTVDDQMPCYTAIPLLQFAKVGEDGALWPVIMEKAFAKLHGNYSRIAGGISSAGISYLNGSPHENAYPQSMSEQEYWDWIVERKDNHGLLVVGTPCNNGGDDTQNELGLVNCHQYAIIDYVILPSGQKLYKVRNPWHSEKYFGPYSDLGIGSNALLDSDLLWLNENGHPHEKANDGEFWMRSEDFYSSAHVVTYNPDVAALGWYHDYHLVIDDDGTGSEPGIWWWCGEFCSRYTAVITNSSDKSNKIHVGLHTWR